MSADITPRVSWRAPFTNREVNELHAEAFDHGVVDDDWATLVERHSLGWVGARSADDLVGFVNVVWDGAFHAWIQDVMVATSHRRRGIARRMVAVATEQARAAGCEWLHVDFDDDLGSLYIDACGFTPSNAGLIQL